MVLGDNDCNGNGFISETMTVIFMIVLSYTESSIKFMHGGVYEREL